MIRRSTRFTIRVTCDGNGAVGEYEFRARSWWHAERRAIEAFIEQCAMAAAEFQPSPSDCRTEIIGVERRTAR